MKSTEERLKKAALGAGCLFLALGAFEMQSHAADAASQVQSRALLVTRGDYEGTEYDLTPGPQNDGVNVSRMLQNAYGGQSFAENVEIESPAACLMELTTGKILYEKEADTRRSPAIALAGMIKAAAYLAGRNYVVPNDVEKVFLAVNHHRIRLNSKARANHVTAEGVLEEIFAGVAKPSPKKN